MLPFNYPLLSYGFILLTLFTAWSFYRLSGRNKWLGIGMIIWLVIHSLLADSGFYLKTDTTPPRLAFVILPMLVIGLLIGITNIGKTLRTAVDLERLHYFHGIRILVELVFLHGLYEAGYLAKALTYEGQNLDIIAGLTGPLIGLLVFRWQKLPRLVAIVWNLLGIALLAWTISRAVLSAPSAYQQYGFEQPTIAIFHFPFIWLPALVAPLMFWAHFMALKKMSA